MKISQNVACI